VNSDRNEQKDPNLSYLRAFDEELPWLEDHRIARLAPDGQELSGLEQYRRSHRGNGQSPGTGHRFCRHARRRHDAVDEWARCLRYDYVRNRQYRRSPHKDRRRRVRNDLERPPVVAYEDRESVQDGRHDLMVSPSSRNEWEDDLPESTYGPDRVSLEIITVLISMFEHVSTSLLIRMPCW
jgi:hypothetical protein